MSLTAEDRAMITATTRRLRRLAQEMHGLCARLAGERVSAAPVSVEDRLDRLEALVAHHLLGEVRMPDSLLDRVDALAERGEALDRSADVLALHVQDLLDRVERSHELNVALLERLDRSDDPGNDLADRAVAIDGVGHQGLLRTGVTGDATSAAGVPAADGVSR